MLFGLALHRWCIRVFHLEPIRRRLVIQVEFCDPSSLGLSLVRALLCVPSGSAVLLQTWVMQFVFSNYPFSVIRLVSDSVCRLVAGYFQPADDPERIPAI
jgi:hypothetical protein